MTTEKSEALTALIEEMDGMIADVNVNEIADHLNEESLWNWCGAWRENARRILKEMKDVY